MLLDKFPDAEDFYKNYWNKNPFIVRRAINKSDFDNFIDGDTLAGLSLEENIKSRIVTVSDDGDKWTCSHGPFEENKFSEIGDKNWNLLVQNVEQYHPDTAKLLKFFNFSPRWLMDDIMVSYSAVGGSVGPHIDSYHVFLVQGIGRRRWKISYSPIENEEYIEGQDLKVLKNNFDGEEVEVFMGDIIYIPPHFAHEGITLEEAMTFSVGFLGPKFSEMLVEYGHYLEEQSLQDERYSGQDLNINSALFSIHSSAQNNIQNNLVQSIQSDDFSRWMAKYFSTPTHDEVENIEERDVPLKSAELLKELEAGGALYRREHIKIAITKIDENTCNLAVYGRIIPVSITCQKIVDYLNSNQKISIKEIEGFTNKDEVIKIVTHLYNINALSLSK